MRPRTFMPLVCMLVITSGCVRRTITITSEPPGALVRLNGREIGRTPVDVDFLYYGVYDVALEKEGYEPLLTTGDVKAPWWDIVPLDFIAEITPGEKHSRVILHYQLQPPQDDESKLLERARELRAHLGPATPQSPATQPGAGEVPASAATQQHR